MNLFEISNYVLQIQPEAYALKPFKDIWDRDKSKDKKTAIQELAYIYYMVDFKSDFAQILDQKQRRVEVVRNLQLPKKWQPDNYVMAAISFYKDRQKSISLLLLEDVYKAIEKLREFYREVDLLKEDPKTGKPIHDVSKLTRSIEAAGKIIESLKKLEDKVKLEQDQSSLRAGKQKGIYEDENV